MEFEVHPASVLLGTCADCGHAFTLVEGTATPAPRVAPPGSEPAAAGAEGAGEAGDEDRLTCGACGSTLKFRERGDSGIQSVCPGCHATENYVAASSVRAPPRERFERPRRFEGRGEGFEAPRTARPCRECGGPLAFSTNPDGTVEGVCQACGNRFTLPPRRDDGRPSDGRRGPRFDRGGGSRYGRKPSFDRRGPRGQDRGFQRYPRRPRPASSDSGDDQSTDRRRRRPRSDDDDDDAGS
jgi:hypothetical protein